MSEQKHTQLHGTPLPWCVQRLHHARGEMWLQIGYEKPDGTKWGPVCRVNCQAEPMPDGVVAEIKHMATSNKRQLADADFIVRAANTHYHLVAALEAALSDGPHNASHGLSGATVELIRAALQAARPGT